ncbi:ParA family protein [Rothia sp. AR01]|uniref:ParA family protein n=1 Tax=Rothia santali TaxID=2949643 RepID=A0A9X2HBI9_9MICC|nr:ParA family protein [Rothia santali]MCP3425190.1 ParA family protein [Rothia santali]
MALTVTLLSSKGGVGKTTASMLIATSLSRRGYVVEVWDADPQASATTWAEMASEEGDPLPFKVTPANIATLKSRKPEAEVLIIDTPPGEAGIQTPAVRRSDMVIIPTGSSWLDVDRMWSTLASMGNVPAIVLPSRVNTRTRKYRDLVEALEGAEVAVFDTTVKELESYRDLPGTNPKKIGGFSSITTEMLDLMEMKR